MATKEYFDRVHEMGKRLKDIFARDRFKYKSGTEDYIIRAVDEAAQHRVQRTVEACPEDRHMYYVEFLTYDFCPYCGEWLHSR